MEQEATKGRKALRIAAYSAADMLGGGVGQVLSLYYFVFLTLVVQLPAWQAGLVTGIGKIWDSITDPMMGIIVDRTKTKFGASRLWMLISVPFLLVSYFMLWNHFGIATTGGKFAYYIFAYMFWSTAFTMAVIPYESLLPKMVSDYQERTNYSSIRMIFSGVACVVTTYIYEWLIPVTTENPLSPAFTSNFTILGIVLAVFFSIPVLITVFGTKEPPSLGRAEKVRLKDIFRNYAEILKSRTYRKCFFLYLLGAFISSAILTSFVLFLLLVYGNRENFLLTFTLTFIVVNLKGAVEIAFFIPNVILMKKKSKHAPYLLDLPMLVLGAVIVLFVNPAVPIWVFLIAAVCFGAGTSCLAFVPNTLMPDLVDVDEMMYGHRREGVSAGLNTFGRKFMQGIAPMLFGFILTAYGLSSETASPADATPGILWGIKIMLAVVPILLTGVMLYLSATYKLNAKSHALIKRLVQEKKETGTTTATSEEIATVEKIAGIPFETMWVGQGNEELEIRN